ncbi:MAG TPA: S8 family serine peptidase [Acidimicrobiales bacterium]|jgi:subtilisin family serine protease|nr:S8 family serine peptidase [Acidimicrobiales bacterium]
MLQAPKARLVAFLAVIGSLGVMPGVAAAAPAAPLSAEAVIVKLKAGASSVDVAQAAGGRVLVGMVRDRAVVKLGKGASLASVRRDPRVEWAEPDVRYRATEMPDDPCLVSACAGARQWAPSVIKATEAWGLTHGSPTMLVAVVDGGVDATHPQLAGKVVVGPDLTGTVQDLCWNHGTHVAGTVAAMTDDAKGVAGIGWDTRVLSIRALSYDPQYGDCSGTLSNIAKGIDTAVAAGARVVNLSLAGTFDSKTVRDSVENAVAHNVVVVAAAGNEGDLFRGNPVMYPAGIGDVLSVAATTSEDHTASFSERGGWIDIAAPGYGIVSTVPGGGYGVMHGTSMATPHAAAAAALLLARSPGLSARQVVARIALSSDDYAGAGRDVRYGRLNVYRALTDDGQPGYYMTGSDGGVFSFGRSGFYGSTGSIKLNKPIVGMSSTPRRRGYWFVASDGGVFNYGGAGFVGALGGSALKAPIVGMAALADGSGYYLFGQDGQVYGFGGAEVTGEMAGFRTKSHVVGGAVTLTGKGLWLVMSNGAVQVFGDAEPLGSMEGRPLHRPVVGMAVTPSGKGYWLVASDGGIFSYGDAGFYGSTGGIVLNRPIVGMQSSVTGQGYWLVASDGGIFSYGDAVFAGSMGGTPLNRPVVGIG